MDKVRLSLASALDFTIQRREVVAASAVDQLPEWDVYISAYNHSERVGFVFDHAKAGEKRWLIHPEYGFADDELPHGEACHVLTSRDEAEYWQQFFDEAAADAWDVGTRICIDSTGFMRPHLMLVLKMLHVRGLQRVDMLYSDPHSYESGDKTPFTKGAVTEVRQVRGFEGNHVPDAGEQDLLIIGAGYDDKLIRRVAENKRSARKVEMFGLPSLQPHMYEENRLNAAAAEEAIGPLPSASLIFAPANDPFATAQELRETVEHERARGLSNIYLSPLATKAQVIGFALFYLCELSGGPASVIFPFAEYYSQETAVGISRIWRYEIELDWFL